METIKQVFCVGCGTSGPHAATVEESWQQIMHEGHHHECEQMTYAQAAACGEAFER